MELLISFPILGGLAIIQSAIVSSVPLLLGTTDLVLVVLIAWALQEKVRNAWQWGLVGGGIMTVLSGLPFGVYLGGYLGAILLAVYIKRRIWKVPFLGMLTAVFIGTLLIHLLSWLSRWLTGVYIPIEQTLISITLPSLMLNLLVAVPAYFLMRDLTHHLYPEEIEV